MNKSVWALRMCNLADHWLQYSSCVRRQVGAVVFDPIDFSVFGTGYNDTAIGDTNCGEGGCVACGSGSVRGDTACRCVHAEMNAMILARRDLRGSWLAMSMRKNGKRGAKKLCVTCRKNLIQAGIVVWVQSDDGINVTARSVVDDGKVVFSA